MFILKLNYTGIAMEIPTSSYSLGKRGLLEALKDKERVLQSASVVDEKGTVLLKLTVDKLNK